MITNLGRKYSFSLLCVSFVNVFTFVCVLSLSGFEGGMKVLVVLVPKHCLSLYFSLCAFSFCCTKCTTFLFVSYIEDSWRTTLNQH